MSELISSTSFAFPSFPHAIHLMTAWGLGFHPTLFLGFWYTLCQELAQRNIAVRQRGVPHMAALGTPPRKEVHDLKVYDAISRGH